MTQGDGPVSSGWPEPGVSKKSSSLPHSLLLLVLVFLFFVANWIKHHDAAVRCNAICGVVAGRGTTASRAAIPQHGSVQYDIMMRSHAAA